MSILDSLRGLASRESKSLQLAMLVISQGIFRSKKIVARTYCNELKRNVRKILELKLIHLTYKKQAFTFLSDRTDYLSLQEGGHLETNHMCED